MAYPPGAWKSSLQGLFGLEVASGLGDTRGLTFHERVYSPLKSICTLGLHNIL